MSDLKFQNLVSFDDALNCIEEKNSTCLNPSNNNKCTPELQFYDLSSYNSYTKGCKWFQWLLYFRAPDGSCICVATEENSIFLYNMPPDIWNGTSHFDSIVPLKKLPQPDTIFDYCWSPLMNSWNSETCLLAVACRGTPIHLFNVNSCKTLSSLKAYNLTEELLTCYSLTFNHDATKIFAGFNKSIKVFDLNHSNICDSISTHNKLYSSKGQHGLISSFAVSKVLPNLFAAGSYTASIGLYTRPENSLVSILHGSQGGITHMLFSNDGSKLYSGGRKDPHITCWDLRNMGKVCQVFDRPVTNNQRIYFDIGHIIKPNDSKDSTKSILASGTMDGQVHFWDLSSLNIDQSTVNLPLVLPTEEIIDPFKFQAHSDTVNGVSLHPHLPLIATTSGKRHIHCKSLMRKTHQSLAYKPPKMKETFPTSLVEDISDSSLASVSPTHNILAIDEVEADISDSSLSSVSSTDNILPVDEVDAQFSFKIWKISNLKFN